MEDFKFLNNEFENGFTVELSAGRNAWQYWHNNKVATVEVVGDKYQVIELIDGKKSVNEFKHQTSVIGAILLFEKKTASSKKTA